METRTSPMALTPASAEAPSSQVLEIHPEAVLIQDQPEEADAWLMEEGDDSVFYSDEEQTNLVKSNSSWDSVAKKSRRLVNSEAHEEQDPGAAAVLDKEIIGMQKEVSLQLILAEQELQNPEPVYVSAESLQLKRTNKQAKPNISSEAENVPVKMEESPGAEPQTSDNRQLDDEDHNCFDHLTSSKYSTVSYRKIRRGNTRQKVQEFEYMIINM